MPLVAAFSASTSVNGTVAPRPGKDHGVSAVVAADALGADRAGTTSTPPARPRAEVTASAIAVSLRRATGRRGVGG